MLNALQEQLKLLAADPGDPFSATVRKIAGPRQSADCERQLRELILAMPAMIGQIRRWLSESKLPSPVRRLHGFTMAYLYSPDDLLPESRMGFFGYIDDAYLAAQVYRRTMLEADCFVFKRFIADEALYGRVQNWIGTVKLLLPAETAAIDRMLEEVILCRSGDFSEMLSRAAESGRTAGCCISPYAGGVGKVEGGNGCPM